MAKPGAGKQPRSKRDFERFAIKHNGEIHEGSKHTLVTGPIPGRPVTLERHTGDYNPRQCKDLLTQLKLIGVFALMLLIPLCLVACLANGLSSMY